MVSLPEKRCRNNHKEKKIMKHVFIVGCKGIPAQYGGFETFVENLTARKKSEEIMYHVSCMNNDEKHFEYNGADCFNVKLPLKGAPGRILHVSRALTMVEEWKRGHLQEEAIVYILGCRIGPMLYMHVKSLHKLGIKVFVNPDGLEWKRDKWNALAKKFLRYCEKSLVNNADLVVCDSKNIEKYILETYPKTVGRTTFIAYGADIEESKCSDEKFLAWCEECRVTTDNYYLIVGRFVPENNYETMITEFMKSRTEKPLIIVSNVEKNQFYIHLKETTGFEQDDRIRFVGTVYDQELLKKIRECAFAYIHGHEVGGTNPSLLEALASTKVNLLLDVGFNREVAEETALYWNKEKFFLHSVINNLEKRLLQSNCLELNSRKRIQKEYSWDYICSAYEVIFTNE